MYLYETISKLAETAKDKPPLYLSFTDNLVYQMLESDASGFGRHVYRDLRASSRMILIYWCAYTVVTALSSFKRSRHLSRMFAEGKNFFVAVLTEQVVRNASLRTNPATLDFAKGRVLIEVPGLTPGDYKVVAVKPPCSLEALKRSIAATRPDDQSTIVLCTHLLSLTEEGLQDLQDLLSRWRLATAEIRPASCVFPISVKTKILIRILLRVCDIFVLPGRKGILSRRPIQYLVSDMLILKGLKADGVSPSARFISVG